MKVQQPNQYDINTKLTNLEDINMAGVMIQELMSYNTNVSNTDVFRSYIKDNFEKIKSECTVISIVGRDSTRYKAKSHSLWIALGLDQRHCMIADFINGIDGDTDLNLIDSIYLPDSKLLDEMARRINR